MGRSSELEHQVDKLNKEKRDYVEEIKVSFIKSVNMTITQEIFFLCKALVTQRLLDSIKIITLVSYWWLLQ